MVQRTHKLPCRYEKKNKDLRLITTVVEEKCILYIKEAKYLRYDSVKNLYWHILKIYNTSQQEIVWGKLPFECYNDFDVVCKSKLEYHMEQ